MGDKKIRKPKKRRNGEGTYGKKIIKGVEYFYFRKVYPELPTENKRKDFTAKTQKELDVKIKEFEAKLYGGNFEVTIKKTFLEYIYWFLENEKKREIKESTYCGYLDYTKMCIESFDDFDLANKQVNQINKELLQKHIDSLSKKYARSTIKKVYSCIIAPALKFAKKNKYITDEFLFDYSIPIEENVVVKKREIVFLTEDEMRLLITEACRINGESINGEKPLYSDKKGTPFYGLNGFAIVLILALACRRGEALALRWSDIDFENRFVRINKNIVRVKNNDKNIETKTIMKQFSPKTECSIRNIPLNDIAILALKNIKKYNKNIRNEDDYVCMGKTGNLIQDRNLRRTLCCIVKRSCPKKEGLTIHGLRHSMTSYIIKKTGNIKTMSEILGHSDVETTLNIYKHITKDEAIEVFNVFQLNNINNDDYDDFYDDEDFIIDTK